MGKRRRWRDATVAFAGERRTAAGDEESVSVPVASIREGGEYSAEGREATRRIRASGS